MVRIAICDDNSFSRDLLSELLDEYKSDRGLDLIVDSFNAPGELIGSVKRNGNYDIYLMDVVMPEMNGIEAAHVLRTRKDEGRIIFLSSSAEYGVASYTVGAFDYQLKPYEADKIFKSLDRAICYDRKKSVHHSIKTRGCTVVVDLRDINCVELCNRCAVYTFRNRPALTSLTLRESFASAVACLTDTGMFGFVSVSTVVNFEQVDALDEGGVLLHDGTQLTPSRGCYSTLKKQWRAYNNRRIQQDYA